LQNLAMRTQQLIRRGLNDEKYQPEPDKPENYGKRDDGGISGTDGVPAQDICARLDDDGKENDEQTRGKTVGEEFPQEPG